MPYRVGTVLGAPRYRRVPLTAEQEGLELGLKRYLKKLPDLNATLKDGLIDSKRSGAKIDPLLEKFFFVPNSFPVEHGMAYPGMKIAWSEEFDAANRTWLVTPDHGLIPKDKVKLPPKSTMQGTDLTKNKKLKFPLIFSFNGAASHYQIVGKNKPQPAVGHLAPHTFYNATGKTKRFRWDVYYELVGGMYVKSTEATLMHAPSSRPSGVGLKEKWIHVSVSEGAMIAYVGNTPVFVTATSPGAGGAGKEKYGTPLGKYNIGLKFISADMAGEDGGYHWRVREVPWVSYYYNSYALHTAWWHDDFGQPKSHGCLNLSPKDAKFMFEWTDPPVPKNWYAVTSVPHVIQGTVVNIVL
jgi:hypothetical protein